MYSGAKRETEWPQHICILFWKIDDNFELARSILMKIVAFGVKGVTNEWAAAPCLGKFVVTRIRRPKVGRDGQNV